MTINQFVTKNLSIVYSYVVSGSDINGRMFIENYNTKEGALAAKEKLIKGGGSARVLLQSDERNAKWEVFFD